MGRVFRYTRLCLVEARPAVLVICLFRFLAGGLLADRRGPTDVAGVAAGAAGWLAATFAIYVYNGVTDREEDVANGSRRPIASGALPVRPAALAAGIATAAALIGGAFQSMTQLLALVVYLAVGYAYSGAPFRIKRSYAMVPPSLAVLGLATYFAGASAAGHRPGRDLVVFAGANALWMAAVGGVAKDMSDVRGDRLAGRRSWPVVLGFGRTRVVLAAAATTVAAGFGVATLHYAAGLGGCAVVMSVGAVAISAACRAIREDASRPVRRLPYRAFMWTQHACHLFLLATFGLRVA